MWFQANTKIIFAPEVFDKQIQIDNTIIMLSRSGFEKYS